MSSMSWVAMLALALDNARLFKSSAGKYSNSFAAKSNCLTARCWKTWGFWHNIACDPNEDWPHNAANAASSSRNSPRMLVAVASSLRMPMKRAGHDHCHKPRATRSRMKANTSWP